MDEARAVDGGCAVDEGRAVVAAHASRLAHLGATPYLHGSLALGGYHHGISDQDVVFLLTRPLTPQHRADIDASHRVAGPSLSAAYVLDLEDHELAHPTWTHGWSGDRRVSPITRAELHRAHPDDWPEIPDLAAVVATEVSRVWSRELRDPRTWLRTGYVDLALTSVVRALLTQADGELTGKDEAIAYLEVFGVPRELADAVAARRRGEPVRSPRLRTAVSARRETRRLLGLL